MSDHLPHLPQIPLGSPHGLKYYGFAAVIAHLPSFVDKMRVHSFGGLCRHVVNMSEAWRDIDTYIEQMAGDLCYRFEYRSRCDGKMTEFVLDGRSYKVYYNRTAVLTNDRYVEVEAFDAMRDVMRFVRGKIRHLRRIMLDAFDGPLIVYRDAIDEWLPRRMVCRVRRIAFESVPWHRDVGGPWTMPKMPKLCAVSVAGVCDQRQLASILGQLCTHNNQLHTVTVDRSPVFGQHVGNTAWWEERWSPLPSQVADNDRLRRLYVCMVPLTWPSNEQFARWASLEALVPPGGEHRYVEESCVTVTAHTLAAGLRRVADGFHHGLSLIEVSCELIAERPTMDPPTAEAKTVAIEWGDAHDWRTPVTYSELASLGFALPIYTEFRAWASAVVAVVEAIRSSPTPGRSVELRLCAHELPPYHRSAVECLLGAVDYSTVSILDRPSVDLFIVTEVASHIQVILIEHGKLLDAEED